MSVKPQRRAFLLHALNLIGTPYLWGGKSSRGIDCSGVVTLALFMAGGPDWRGNYWTDRLWKELAPVLEPVPGDLCFYGPPGDVRHVMLFVGLGLVFGARGGDSTTTSIEVARARAARVEVRELNYRPDFRGYRSMSGVLR